MKTGEFPTFNEKKVYNLPARGCKAQLDEWLSEQKA